MAKDRIERDELASKLIETATSAEDPLRAMAELLTDFVMEAEVTAKVGAEPLALYNIGPFAPGHVLFDGLLHFLWAELLPAGGIIIERQHILRHGVSPYRTP